MLTDIFATRYQAKVIFPQFREPQRRLLVQAYKLVCDDLPAAHRSDFWDDLHKRISTELGILYLSKIEYRHSGNIKSLDTKSMGQAWLLAAKRTNESDDDYLKDRMSFVELAFRQQGALVSASEALLQNQTQKAAITIEAIGANIDAVTRALAMPGAMQTLQASATRDRRLYDQAVHELNVRLQQAGAGLHYHNGFLQIAGDLVAAQQIEEPFWSLVADEKWGNVDHDMKEAIDARDTDGRDPGWFAARALESTIKIISNARQLTSGKERGAQAFAENLLRGKLIATWELDQLRLFFSNVRNELGHGPGDKPMPELPPEQTDWAIEFCMTWIRLLVRRHEK